MSITGMLNTGLSALLANQTALRVTGSNIANVNTPGYVRRTVDFESRTAGDLLGGIDVGTINRAVDQFLTGERLTSASAEASADAAGRFLDQLQASLGNVADGRDPASRWATVSGELASLANDPSSTVKRAQFLQALGDFTQGVEALSAKVQDMRTLADGEIGTTVTRVNELIDQISGLNTPIQRAVLSGDEATPLLDQRDNALRELAGLIDIRVDTSASGRVNVTTTSGFSLISQNTAEVTHLATAAVGPGTSFPSITIARRNPETGVQVGTSQPLEPHLSDGKLAALLKLRDVTLPGIGAEIGALAAGAAEALNAAHNASTAYPPPASLSGRDTGLLASDALNFTGRSSLAVVGANGALVRRVDIDFSAGTLSVNGGAATAFTQTVGGLTAAVNTALGGNGSASFANGALTLNATGGNGIAVQQDAANPSARGGRGFAQVFGLNDLVVSSAPTSFATGLSAADQHGFTAGQRANFVVRDADGTITRRFSYVVAGNTIGDVVTGLNAASGTSGTFSLDASGKLSFAGASGGKLEVEGDNTSRGANGMGLTTLFGLGQGAQMAQAVGFAIRPDLMQNPNALAMAQLDMTSASTVGQNVLASADGKGASALIAKVNMANFAAAGTALARAGSVQDYAGSLITAIGQRAAAAETAAEDAASLKTNVEQRAQQQEGVNLDEELAAMIMYQQAYNASARIITTAQKLYDEILGLLK